MEHISGVLSVTDLLCFVHNKLECEKLKPIIVAGFQDVVVQGRTWRISWWVQKALKCIIPSRFLSKINITYERYRFFSRNRHLGETIEHYVTELRTLARTCSFDHLEESLIKDWLVLGIGDPCLKERLLRTEDLDLQKACLPCGRVKSSADARVRWRFRSIELQRY